MDIIIQPALFIGLGGTGREVVDRLRRRIAQRVGTDRLPGLIEFLYVDTDGQSNSRATDSLEGVSISLGPRQAQELLEPDGRAYQELELQYSLDAGAREELRRGSTGGARGIRPLGHLSFLTSASLRPLAARLQEILGALSTADDQVGKRLAHLHPAYLTLAVRGVRPTVLVYVIASAGGGTGSSTQADLGYFLRRVLRSQNWDGQQAGGTQRFTTVSISCLASSSVVENDQMRINSAAVLVEFDHYLLGRGYRGAYPTSFPKQPLNIQTTGPYKGLAEMTPYDVSYVVEPTQKGGRPLEATDRQRGLERLEQKVAELLVADLVFTAADGDMVGGEGGLTPWARPLRDDPVAARVRDMESFTAQHRWRDMYPCELMTFGVTARETPVALHHILAFEAAIEKLAERWTTPATERNQAADRLLATWRSRLHLYENQGQFKARQPRRVEQDGLLSELLKVVGDGDDPVRSALRAATRLNPPQPGQEEARYHEALSRVTGLCAKVPNTPPLAERGGVYAALRDRAAVLAGTAGWSTDSLPYQVCAELLTLAFNAQAGPAWALACCDRLAEAVSWERQLIDECRAAGSTPEHDDAGAATSAQPSTQATGDWLLWWWGRYGAQAPDTSADDRRLWAKANDLLLRLVLDEKIVVLEQVADALKKLRQRLTYLQAYFKEWAAQIGHANDYRPDTVASEYVLVEENRIEGWSDPNRLELPLSELDLYDELLKQVRSGLPKEVDGTPALLAGGLPRNRAKGTTDFAYLAAVEKAVFEAIGARPDGPYSLEVIEAIRRRAAAAKSDLPDLNIEAGVLLNFDLDSGYRSDCDFSGDVDYWHYLAGHDSDGHQPFMRAVDEGRRAHMYSDRSQTPMQPLDTHMRSMVALVHHRRGVVSALISGYDPEDVQRMTTRASIVPFVDARLRAPIPPDLLNEARELYFGCLVLGKGTVFSEVASQRFVFRYTVERHGAPQAQTAEIPSRFDQAVEELARNDDLRKRLSGAVEKVKLERGDWVKARLEEMFSLLNQHISQREQSVDYAQRRIDVWAGKDSPSGIYLHGLSQEYGFTLLARFAHGFKIACDFQVEHNHAVYVRSGQSIPVSGGIAQQDGYYCKFCGIHRGSRIPSNNELCRSCKNHGLDSQRPEDGEREPAPEAYRSDVL